MLKNKTTLEIKKEERIYQFIIEPTSPLGEIFDVLCQMKAYVLQVIQETEKNQEKKEETNPEKE